MYLICNVYVCLVSVFQFEPQQKYLKTAQQIIAIVIKATND